MRNKMKMLNGMKLAHGLGEKYSLNDQEMEGLILERSFEPGEEIILRRTNP
jgi:hypothetical protein